MSGKVGRPLKYKTVKELKKAVDSYFKKCKPKPLKDKRGKVLTNSNGVPLVELNPPTITGLAIHLGFDSRQSLYNYRDREEFLDTIKEARLKCEHWVEKALLSGNTPAPAGIFALKNYGWSDKQEIEHSGESIGTSINIIGVVPKNTEEDG